MPLPAILAEDIQAELPWLVLEWLAGTDLGAVISRLAEEKLDGIAANLVQAQSITAETGSAGRYGYAAQAEQTPHTAWSHVLDLNVARSRRRMASAGLFDPGLVDIVQTAATAPADPSRISRRNIAVGSDVAEFDAGRRFFPHIPPSA